MFFVRAYFFTDVMAKIDATVKVPRKTKIGRVRDVAFKESEEKSWKSTQQNEVGRGKKEQRMCISFTEIKGEKMGGRRGGEWHFSVCFGVSFCLFAFRV
jgi:hypothetical protein